MITFIGITLVIVALFLFFYNRIRNNVILENEETRMKYANDPNFLRSNTKSVPVKLPIGGKWWVWLVGGILVLALNGLFFWANAGTAYAVQFPWGGDKAVTTQGMKMKFWGRTIPMSYEMSVKDVITKLDQDGEMERLPLSDDGIYNRAAQNWEFADAIKARIAFSVIVGVNLNDEQKFLEMADRNRSESKLIYGRVLPNIDAALKNTCKLMDAQDYISGKASDFDRYFRDQLENGMYLVEEYYEESDTPEVIGDTSTVRTINNKRSSRQVKYKIKRDANGKIMRDNNSNTLTQYGITIYQAQVTGIDWEKSFDERLDLQKNEVAQTQLEKQQAEREVYRAQKEIAKGEADKATERARLEKEQIKLTIAAETEAKVAEQNVIVEKRQLEVEKFKAQSKKVAADAQYYENQKLVQAGLTPQQRMEMDIKIIDVATKNMAGPNGITLPNFYMTGGDGKNPNDPLSQVMQLMLAKDLMKE